MNSRSNRTGPSVGQDVQNLHVLVLPSWYPSPENPQNGLFFRDQARALLDADYRVGVIFPHLRPLGTLGVQALGENHGQITSGTYDGIPTVRWHGWNVPLARMRPPLFSVMAERLLEAYERRFGHPDLIHAHSSFWAGYAADRLGRRHDLPYVLTEHHSSFIGDGVPAWRRPIAENSFASASRLLAVSDALRQAMRPYVGDRSIHVVPNVVDTSFFRPPGSPRRASPFRFLTVGFLNERKAIDVLLRAFHRAFPEDDSAVLEIGGDGPSRAALERLATDLGLADRVRFLGMLSRDGVKDALHRANTFVLSSRRETFGVVLIEAMATGVPVVATRAGGPPEEIVTSPTGLLVEPNDVEGMADALAEIRSRRTEYSSEAIRRHTVKRFGPAALVERLTSHYRSVVQDAGLSAAIPHE